MIDVSLYSTEPGSKRVTVCIQDFEVAVLIVAQLHKAAEAALDKSDYGKLSKLAHEADELMQAVTLAFKSEGIVPEDSDININLQTGEIVPPDGCVFASERNSSSQCNELATDKASITKTEGNDNEYK